MQTKMAQPSIQVPQKIVPTIKVAQEDAPNEIQKKKRLPMWIISILVLIVVAVVVYYFLIK